MLPQLDEQTREIVVTASENGGQWAGLGPVGRRVTSIVLMLTQAQSCELTRRRLDPAADRTALAPIGSETRAARGRRNDPTPTTYVMQPRHRRRHGGRSWSCTLPAPGRR